MFSPFPPATTPIKPTILLCWGYNRQGWVEAFEILNDRFDFVYLYYFSKPENDIRYTYNPVIYWSDYESPCQILEKIKPEKVVFMDIYSGLGIALNLACRKRGIPTFFMQHGQYSDYNSYRKLELLHLKNKSSETKVGDSGQKQSSGDNHTIKFLRKSVPLLNPLELTRLVLYFYLLRKMGTRYAAKKIKPKSCIPDYYLCYTERNATIHFELDNPSRSKMIYIGPPEYDKFFNPELSDRSIEEKYYLLIDQPLAQNQYFSLGISRQQVNDFYLKLATFCRSQGAKLVVKLHPENYSDTWLLQDEAIIYARDDHDQVSLIKNAEGCFGTFSTLLIPAVYFKPCIIFRLFDSVIQEQLIRQEVVASLDYFDFKTEDIDFAQVKKIGKESKEFIRDFFYKDDANAIERLSQVLEKTNTSLS